MANYVPTDRAIFVWPWKMVSVRVRYLFNQPMDEKIRTWTLRFPAKENLNMEKALFDWPIVLQYDVKAKYRLISRKFSGRKFFHPSVRLTNQKPRAFVSIRWTNQIAVFPFVCCFCFVRAFSFQGHTKIAQSSQCFVDVYFVLTIWVLLVSIFPFPQKWYQAPPPLPLHNRPEVAHVKREVPLINNICDRQVVVFEIPVL